MINKLVMAVVGLMLGTEGGGAIAGGSEGLYLRFDSSSSSLEQRKETVLVEGEVGYRVNQYMRSDITLTHRPDYGEMLEVGVGRGNTNFKMGGSAFVGMVNVYADIARFSRFTSYIGGGIGFARNMVVTDAVITPDFGVRGMLTGDTKIFLAWQLTLGIGVTVAPNWTIDGGYRYLDLGEVGTGDSSIVNGVVSSGGTTENNGKAHEARLGMRYQF